MLSLIYNIEGGDFYEEGVFFLREAKVAWPHDNRYYCPGGTNNSVAVLLGQDMGYGITFKYLP